MKGVKKPEAPSETEVIAHRLRGHIPYAAWCQECILGRGQEDSHLRGGPDAGLPVVQWCVPESTLFTQTWDSKPVGVTHGDADSATPEQPREPGVLADIAAKVIMEILYVARRCRFDLLRAIISLACHVAKWDVACDQKL